MLLPLRSKNPPESFPVATVCLIALNILFFGLTVGDTLHLKPEALQLFGLSRGSFYPLTLISQMFLHENLLHLAGNMWFLYLFGFAVEGRLKAGRFLLLYFASGIFGALVWLFLAGSLGQYLVGASAAIFGVLGAALYLFPYSQFEFFCGLPAIGRYVNWCMIWVAVYFIGLDLVYMLAEGFSSNVAHVAHISGAIAGAGLCILMRPLRDSRKASDAKAMFTHTRDLSRLSSAELAAMSAYNPTNTALILNWMHRNIRDGHVRPECLAAFLRLLPEIVRREPAPTVGYVLVSLISVGAPIPSAHLLRVGQGMEMAGEVTLALRLYHGVLRNPASTQSEVEAALFQSAGACEKLNNRQQAARTYRQVIERFPMSPIADQAKNKLLTMVG